MVENLIPNNVLAISRQLQTNGVDLNAHGIRKMICFRKSVLKVLGDYLIPQIVGCAQDREHSPSQYVLTRAGG